MIYETPKRNISVAPPYPRECITMYKSLKPNFYYPITDTVALSFARNCYGLIYIFFTCSYWYAHIFVSSEVLLIYITCFTTFVPDLTGHSSLSSVLSM